LRGPGDVGSFSSQPLTPFSPARMTDPSPDSVSSQDRFRRTLIQVLIVQTVALGVLGLLQILYS